MGNIKNNNAHVLMLRVDKGEYWDFCVNKYDVGSYSFSDGSVLDDKCLISYIDLENPVCVDGEDLVSTDSYVWPDAVNNGTTLYNIGYTGVDNGLIRFEKDRITNADFVKLYSSSEYSFTENDMRLRLHPVTGNTMEYVYPYKFLDGSVALTGGFFQGMFMDKCDTYKVLPTEIDDSWHFEFTLKPEDWDVDDRTINAKHPENAGIFFFMGLRAENKWEYLNGVECSTLSMDNYADGVTIDMDKYIVGEFHGEMIDTTPYKKDEHDLDSIVDYDDWTDDFIDYGGVSGFVGNSDGFVDKCDGDCDYIAEEMDISNIGYKTTEGQTLEPGGDRINVVTDNKFLLFDRTPDGFDALNWEEGLKVRYLGEKREYKENPFLIFNRTCTGATVTDAEKFLVDGSSYNIYNDIYDNGIAFRIDKNGAIGYKMITRDCDSDDEGKMKVLEGYSNDGIVKTGEWSTINVRLRRINDKMCFYFYVGGKLKYVTGELPLLRLRDMKVDDTLEEGVPYNISLGGGTQGLMETIMPNYMLVPDFELPIESAFAGTFVGEIKTFRFFDCHKEYMSVKGNYLYEKRKINRFV